MSEMIERVARQFAANEGWEWNRLDEVSDTSFGWARNHIRGRVYDDILAMREPTHEMSTHAFMTCGDEGSLRLVLEAGWRAMIDEALR